MEGTRPAEDEPIRVGTVREAMISRGENACHFVYEGVLSGYRLRNLTVTESLQSLFRWHNETLNVWTHLVGFFLFVCLLVYTATRTAGTATPVLSPLRACVKSSEKVACLRNLTLATLGPDQLVHVSNGLEIARNIPRRAVEVVVAEASWALNASATGAHDIHAQVAHQLAGLRTHMFNVTVPEWMSGNRTARAAASPACAEAPGQCRSSNKLGALVRRIRQRLGPRHMKPIFANLSATNLLRLAAGGLEHIKHSAMPTAVSGLSLHNVTSHLAGLQLSALISSMPHLPELSDLQHDANKMLHTLSETLADIHLLDHVSSLERWCGRPTRP